MIFTGCQEAHQKVAGRSRACSSRTPRYMDTQLGTTNTSKRKDPRIVYTIKIKGTNVYMGCHPHDLDTRETTNKTEEVIPQNTRRQNMFNRQTWQEFYLRKAFWKTASMRISKASRRHKQSLDR
jgi:hypothetical protein